MSQTDLRELFVIDNEWGNDYTLKVGIYVEDTALRVSGKNLYHFAFNNQLFIQLNKVIDFTSSGCLIRNASASIS